MATTIIVEQFAATMVTVHFQTQPIAALQVCFDRTTYHVSGNLDVKWGALHSHQRLRVTNPSFV